MIDEHRLTVLEQDVKHLKATHEKIVPKIDQFDKACDISLPKLETTHKAQVETSVMISDINMKLNVVLDRLDGYEKDTKEREIRKHQELKERNERDAVFKAEVTDVLNSLRNRLNQKDIDDAITEGKRQAEKELQDARQTRNAWVVGVLTTILIGFGSWVALSIIDNKVAIASTKEKSTKTKKKKEKEDNEPS